MNNYEKLGIVSNQRFVSTRFLASYLGMNPSTIEQWVHDKKIPCYKICGSNRYDIYEIEGWLQQCKVKENLNNNNQ